jgi:hypothetical protein
LRRAALEQRATLLAVFDPELRLPVVGRSHYEVREMPPDEWRCLGYHALGPRACRVDLAERAAHAIHEGASEAEALRCLSVPRRDAPHVARALRHAILPRNVDIFGADAQAAPE